MDKCGKISLKIQIFLGIHYICIYGSVQCPSRPLNIQILPILSFSNFDSVLNENSCFIMKKIHLENVRVKQFNFFS